MKQALSMILCLVLVLAFPVQAYAVQSWPDQVVIEAEGGIVMDADTGTVLYGKNIHTTYFPASITKILTALIVIENCDLEEMVTFSHNAVYNVESGSTSAGLEEGDVISVRDCLYALLLKSANEAANALAEHVSGSTEQFAELMNQRAASLGCQDSHFANPSGLNDPNHYVSAYDMALIGQAALKNETFLEIDSTLYYDLPITKRNPEGARIYPGHKMLKKNMAEYYNGCIGGKTGYTSLAGNTLITFANRDGMTLIAVVLNGHQTHYTDTKALLDFGFYNFRSIKAVDYDTRFSSVENDMTIAGMSTSELYGLCLDSESRITLPKSVDFSALTSSISYDLTQQDPPGAVARIQYQWEDKNVGTAYLQLNTVKQGEDSALILAELDNLTLEPESQEEASSGSQVQVSESPSQETAPDSRLMHSQPAEKQPAAENSKLPVAVWAVLGAVVVLAFFLICFLIKQHRKKEEEEAQRIRHKRRLERLEENGISAAQFDLLLEQRRLAYTIKQPSRRRKRRK